MTPSLQALTDALADRYRIERELGQGGMATVYLAEDVKHHRKVAVKVLRPELAAMLGPERFLREIETTANLRHPHILPLYDSGDAAGFLFYVMPLVEGESLRDRLNRDKQLPIEEALQITREVADALGYAHGRHIIHRDIKPENILLESGHAVVTDFGIAKAVSAAGGETLTATGLSIGTPQYMSPEQAAAERELDGRSDLYSLGCVLFEMLAGRPPFMGPTVESITHQHVMAAPPPITQLRPAVPAEVAAALQRALAKAPADRFNPVAQFSDALVRPKGAATVVVERRRPRGLTVTAIAILLAVVAGAVVLRGRAGTGPITVVGRTIQVTREPGLEVDPALSPDGQFVAYASGPTTHMQIFVKQVAGGRTVQLTDDPSRNNRGPRWSPDGTRIAYQATDGIYVVPALGGAPRLLTRLPPGVVALGAGSTPLMGLTWSPDGRRIAFAGNTVGAPRIFVVGAEGGEPSTLSAPDQVHSPTWSPDGRHIAVVSGNVLFVFGSAHFGNSGGSSLWVIPLDGSPPVRVTDASSMNGSPQWNPDGRAILFVSDRGGSRDIYRVRVAGNGAPSEAPERLTTGLSAHSMTFSADGRHLAYAQLESYSNIWSVPVPRGGLVSETAPVPVTTGNQVIETLDISRDGKWLVFDSDRNGKADIYKLAVTGGEPIQLTTDSVGNHSAAWSPDGQRIAFHTIRNGKRDVYTMNADGTDQRQRTQGIDPAMAPVWSPSGDTLAIQMAASGTESLLIVPLSGPPATRRLALDVVGDLVVWSPVGAEIAYHTANGIRIISPAGGASWPLTDNTADGTEALGSCWSPDGSAFYYLALVENGWVIRTQRRGEASRILVRFNDPVLQYTRFGFRTDGHKFYLTLGSHESDVWVMEVGQ